MGGGYNELIVEEGCRLKKCCFRFFGENNRIIIKNDCKLIELDVWCSEGSTIIIHNNTHIVGNVHMAAIERTKISVGKECLFSSEIVIRTGDSHSILNSNGNRINESRDILIDDHVWIGQRVTILKGAVIGKDCVIGTGSIVTGNIFEKGSIIAGVPSKIVKSGITWHHELL